MRLFVAVNFTEELKNALTETENALRRWSVSGNFSRKENLHLTLAFLGEVEPDRVEDLEEILDGLRSPAATLTLGGFGRFMERGEALYWRGILPNRELSELNRELVAALNREGFRVDKKPFRPHITLVQRCRLKPGFSEEKFREQLPGSGMRVDLVSLMESSRVGGKLVYTEIYRSALLRNCNS